MQPSNDMPDDATLAELAAAGEIVDKLIPDMLGRGLSPVAVASALLGGALCLVAKTSGTDGALRLLRNAEAGVRAGHLDK